MNKLLSAAPLLLLTILAALPVISSCGKKSQPAPTVFVKISGRAHNFGPTMGQVAGAEISILEVPGITTSTDEQGYFTLEKVPGWREITLVLKRSQYPEVHTETFALEDADLTTVTFQAPDIYVFHALATLFDTVADVNMCNIASTVSTEGQDIWDSGEPGSVAVLEPPLSAVHGPKYFDADTMPDVSLNETSTDGGIVFMNVPPGTYYLTALKAGVNFRKVKIKCLPNVLINASPPWGVQGKFQ